MILDIGCGFRPKGNVNIDLFDVGNEVFAGKHFFKRCPRSIPNFIFSDGQYLPIRNKVFEESYSKGVIEHTENPSLFLKEMVRVSKTYFKLIVPHRFFKQPKYHIRMFNMKQLEKYLNKMFFSGRISQFELRLSYRGFPHQYLSILRRPFLITIEVWLKGFGFFRERDRS